MRLPLPRGPISTAVIAALRTGTAPDVTTYPSIERVLDDDPQLALWVLYELHFQGFDEVDDAREWDPALLAVRGGLEATFEARLRAECAAATADVPPCGDDPGAELLDLVAGLSAHDGPSVAAYVQRHATREQVRDLLRERSVFGLKESDPHSFVLPRIEGSAKAALAELQYDEYGGGRPERLHATMYAAAMAGAGLDTGYGHYLNTASAETLAVNNQMSMFCLHRRLRGAALGQQAAFEATSAVPSRRLAAGIERVGLPEVTAAYFSEHVEADAVHEQVAARDICGVLVRADPTLWDDVVLGAASCLWLEGRAGEALLERWSATAGLEQVAS